MKLSVMILFYLIFFPHVISSSESQLGGDGPSSSPGGSELPSGSSHLHRSGQKQRDRMFRVFSIQETNNETYLMQSYLESKKLIHHIQEELKRRDNNQLNQNGTAQDLVTIKIADLFANFSFTTQATFLPSTSNKKTISKIKINKRTKSLLGTSTAPPNQSELNDLTHVKVSQERINPIGSNEIVEEYETKIGQESDICDQLKKTRILNVHQSSLCLKDVDAIVAALTGKRIGLLECSYQFQFERWNCSISPRLAAVVELKDIYPENKNVGIETKDLTTTNVIPNPISSEEASSKIQRKIKKDLRKRKSKSKSGDWLTGNFKSEQKQAKKKHPQNKKYGSAKKANYETFSYDTMMMDDINAGSPNGNTKIRGKLNGKRRKKEIQEIGKKKKKLNQELHGTLDQLEEATKETAFIQAITSAGVAHAVTQSCSSGNLTDCSCLAGLGGVSSGENPRKPRYLEASPKSEDDGWKWGGCSDNIEYGLKFAEQFTDIPEKARQEEALRSGRKRDIKALVNLHNNEVGRKVLYSLMQIKCRCHGVSGSCGVRTCWKALPHFREVGDALKKKYESSVEISPKIPDISTGLGKGRKQIPQKNGDRLLLRREKRRRREPISNTELVYVERSPNFCKRDASRGVAGTKGRICQRDSEGPESCESLCCGRGYRVEIVRSTERCNCKFVWCCTVQCKTCEKVERRYTCK